MASSDWLRDTRHRGKKAKRTSKEHARLFPGGAVTLAASNSDGAGVPRGKRRRKKGWTDSSVVKSTNCSIRGLELRF